MDFGIAAISLFEPIFLFSIGYTLAEILFFYVILYGVYLVLLPVIGSWVGRLGYEHSIFYSHFFLIAAYLTLFGISEVSALYYVAPVIFAIQKALYWPAYHADLTIFSRAGQRGREVGYIEMVSMVMMIIGPMAGGLILGWFNFSVLFIVVTGLILLSALPLLHIKEIHARVQLSYRETVLQLFSREHRRSFFAFFGFGEELIALVAWPVFLYVVIGNYLTVGWVVSSATLATALLVLWFGHLTDKYPRLNILRAGTLLYVVTWLVRGLIRSVPAALALHGSARLAKEMVYIPMESIRLEKARRVGPLSYAIFFEMSLALGKIVAGLIGFYSATYLSDPWNIIFMTAAFFSLLYFFKKDEPRPFPFIRAL